MHWNDIVIACCDYVSYSYSEICDSYSYSDSDTVVCVDLQYNVIAHVHDNDSTLEQGGCGKIESR